MAQEEHGPKYEVNIEGTVHPWDKGTISVPELRDLGSLPQELPVVEINLHDNTEVTLEEDAVVELKPGQGFAKKIKFQRG